MACEHKGVLRGRFAPSPTGRMHAGNIYAALMTWLLVKSRDGKILLRIEDLDPERSKPEFIDHIQSDFENLGLEWDEGPLYQSNRGDAYQHAYDELSAQGLVYPCFCTRAQIKAMRDIASAPHSESGYYPGICRGIPEAKREELMRQAAEEGTGYSLRLMTDMRNISFDDVFQGPQCAVLDSSMDDFIIKRSDGLFAYQLAVVVDDAAQGVNFVSRGIDLLPSTPKQIYIHELLGLSVPEYAHFPLLVNHAGKRLAKRDRAAAIDELLSAYGSPEAVIGHIAYIAGILPHDGMRMTPYELLPYFNEISLQDRYRDRDSLAFE